METTHGPTTTTVTVTVTSTSTAGTQLFLSTTTTTVTETTTVTTIQALSQDAGPLPLGYHDPDYKPPDEPDWLKALHILDFILHGLGFAGLL